MATAEAIANNPNAKMMDVQPSLGPTPALPSNKPPSGWDQGTYDNFKKANPTLEPTAQDTSKMQGTAYTSVSPTQAKQPPQEPAVVSSTTIGDKVIPQNNDTFKNLSDKGTYVDQGGTMRYSDGTLVPAPVGTDSNSDGTWGTGGEKYGAPPNFEGGDLTDPSVKAVNDLLAGMKQSLDAGTKKQIDVIEQNHAILTQQMQAANESAGSATQHALLTSGTTRYAPADAGGQMMMQTSIGLQKLQSLDAQENTALAAAEKAQNDGNQQIFDKALADVQAIRTAKQTQATKIADAQQVQIQKGLETQQAGATDNMIARIVDSGVTDPSQIVRAMNDHGMPVTMDAVSKTLKAIADSKGAAGIKGLTGDVGNFYALKNTPGALPSSILALPQDQQLAAYIGMVNGAKKASPAAAPSGGGAVSGAASDIVGSSVPVVGFDASTGPNEHDQAAFLAALPGGEHGDLGTKIRGMADYSINPATFPTRLLKGQTGLTRADAVTLAKQFDPSYDENNFTAAAALQKSITSGNYSQAIASANTLIQHLKKLSTDASGLPNYNFTRHIPGVATASTMTGSLFHNAAINNFKIDTGAIATEAAKIYKSTGAPATTEIEDWQKSINPNMAPSEVQGAIKTIIELMAGKLSSISSNYQQTLGKPYTHPMLTPQSLQILKEFNIDPNTIDPTQSMQPQIGDSSTLSGFLASAPATAKTSTTPTINWGAAQ